MTTDLTLPSEPSDDAPLTVRHTNNEQPSNDLLWPFVADPVGLLNAITDWLGGYTRLDTRRQFAETLGLPVNTRDFADWTSAHVPYGWAAARTAYAEVVKIAPPRKPTCGWLGSRGPIRDLHWFRWLVAHELDPLRVRNTHVREWLEDLGAAGAATNTRQSHYSRVKSLYEHLVYLDLVDGNPAGGNRRRLGLTANKNTANTIVLTPEQIRALLDSAGTPRGGQSALMTARAHAIIALLTLGLRASEVCELNRVDLHVTRGRRALRVHGKGQKERVVYLSGLADDALTKYLDLLDRCATTAITRALTTYSRAATPLIITQTGRRYNRHLLWVLVRRIAAAGGEELASIATQVHPHALRHSYVTIGVEASGDLYGVSQDVGHSSPEVTQRVYNHAAPDPARSAVDAVSDAILHS